jgi:hypothetical protein
MMRVTHPVVAIGGFAAIAAAVFLVVPPVPQLGTYHAMADQRLVLGIPNALNVLSNLPFALVGLVGLAALPNDWRRWPYGTLFVCTALTTLGSSYYHLSPNNARLLWDRLPIAIGFMGLVTAIVADRVGIPVARRMFVPLLVVGAGSVVYWYATELAGHGDLRPWGIVQFGSLIAVALLLRLYPTEDFSRRSCPATSWPRCSATARLKCSSSPTLRSSLPGTSSAVTH